MSQSASELDAFFGARAGRLGVVVGGSLSRGIEVKLDPHTDIEELAAGRYVVVHGRDHDGRHNRFFSMITDIGLGNTNAQITNTPPDTSNPYLAEVYMGSMAYGTMHVSPMLMINKESEVGPVRTIPPHFQPVWTATERDINDVFGHEDEAHFHIGNPLELENTQINVDLKRLTERSVGIFGKSGTGKSYLCRILLAGVISRRSAVNLVFDMHNDYGWEVHNEHGRVDKGLKQLFPDRLSIFTLDPESSRRRNAPYDVVVTLAYSDIEPEDLGALRNTMDISDAMLDAAYTLKRIWKENWIQTFLTADVEDLEEIVETTSINASSMSALRRRLERFQRWGFLTPQPQGDSVKQIIDYLENRTNVVLEFGRYGNSLEAYILVANYLTRRIRDHYVKKVEESLGDRAKEPPQLMITIEEAHKFLEPKIAQQTIFGTIARELRKYKVTLLIVDQRPSAIDEEVMSQIGTRVTALLDNDRDITAVLMGVSGAAGLREVLARLDTRQQAIVLGHAVPMPVVIKTRAYDEAFYMAMGGELQGVHTKRKRKKNSDALYGDDGFDGLD
ncbi:MAG: ATP-binding protein [Chloroflexi bacterium]|nr:ATP-binding protein [Chloroflexota bacterium]